MAKGIADGFGLKLRGKVGSVVFVQTRYGLVIRPRTIPANPRTPAQVAARERLARAGAAYRTLTPAQHAAWVAYARSLTRFSRFEGSPYQPAPHSLFIALAAKFLQIDPSSAIPLGPPSTPFVGDGITLAAAGGTGIVTFVASGPNAAGVLTELLLQPLSHPGRAPKPRQYRSQTFVDFRLPILDYAVAAAPGAYAPAFRFVRAATGQEIDIVPLPAVQVA